MRSDHRESHVGISLGRMFKYPIVFSIFVTLHFYICVSSASNKRHHNKRQYIDNPLKIDHWSGPFFSEDQQANAFKDIVRQLKGGEGEDVTASKRMELKGIDPRKILNPTPILQKRKVMKDEGPVAETYVGKNPFSDRGVEISPQERLANLVSEPIIHELAIQPARKKSKSEPVTDIKKVKQQQQLQQQEQQQQQQQHQQQRQLQQQQSQLQQQERQQQHQQHQSQELQQHQQPQQQHQKLDKKKLGKISQMFGSHEIQQLLFHTLPEYSKFSDHRNYFDNHEGYDKEEEPDIEKPHSLGRSRHNFGLSLEHHRGSNEGRHYKGDEDHEHQHEDDEGEEHEDEDREEEDHEDSDHESNDDHDHEEDEGDGDYHEGDYHHGHHEEDDEREDQHHLGNEGGHAFDYDTSNEKLNSEIENELSIHRANEQRPTFRDDQVENQYEKDVTSFSNVPDEENDHMIPQNKRSEIQNKLHCTSKNKKKDRSSGKFIGKKHHMSKFTSISNNSAGKSLSITRGNSDIHAPEGFPLGDTSAELNSHSGVFNLALGVMSQSEIPKSDSQHPLPLHDDSTVASRVLSGETLFQLPKAENHSLSDTQLKEDADTETIFVHHHKNRKKKTETHKLIKDVKSFKLKKSLLKKTIFNERSHKGHINSHKFRNEINGSRRDDIVKPTNKKRWSHSINHHGGILEDNVNDDFHSPHIMTVGTREGTDLHKDWNNMHSPGNGFYNGRGVGPARIQDSEYVSHNQHESTPMLNGGDYFENGDSPIGQVGTHVGPLGSHSLNPHTIQFDPVHSLSASDSHTDHETAGIIDAIWEHDYEGHVGRNHDRRKEGMLGFFEHNDQNALLPAETLDGIAEHWERGHHGNRIFDGEGVPQAVVHNTEGKKKLK